MALNGSLAEYEYRGLKAASWDLFLGQTPVWEDTFFFREQVARFGQPALELGCGTGRLLLAYLGDGFDIDGVDNSPEMLDICREKATQLGLRPNLYRQAMQSLDLPRRYKSIIVPAGSFQLITNPAQARQALRRIVDHLLSGGGLAMRFMLLWQPGDPQQRDWRLLGDAIRPEDGAQVRWWQRARRDVVQQLEHTEDRLEVLLRGQVTDTERYLQSPAARWYTRGQALALFKEAGLTDVRLVEAEGAVAKENRHFAVIGTRG
jgi:SAM-dependent methyltransferase